MANKPSLQKESLALHKKLGGKISVTPKIKVQSKHDLSLVYTPGVAAVSLAVAAQPKRARELTWKKNTIAVVSDGSAVLGLGNIGPEAALPVMEGKALLFKELGDVDAVPIVLDVHDEEGLVQTIKALAPGFGGINLEDIAAPLCFVVEERLKSELSIPVMHDDQHGTAVVVLAGLINALRVVGKKADAVTVVISGVGAAGVAIIRLLKAYAPKMKIIAVDSRGIISQKQTKRLNGPKRKLLQEKLIVADREGAILEALVGADILIGVSQGNSITAEMVASMKKGAIVFAMANPDPEILPKEAKRGGARVVATGRSDFPNQINNALVFPGIFRGALDAGVQAITQKMLLQAAKNVAELVAKPTPGKIIPDVLDKRAVRAVAKAISGKKRA